jgi:hypothetical protein
MPPWYGTVCQVVWEDEGDDSHSYLILERGERKGEKAWMGIEGMRMLALTSTKEGL